MKKLVWGALLLGGVAQASGCIITTDDEVVAHFEMAWTLTAGANTITCTEAGAGGVQSLATLAGTMQGYKDIFTCADGAGTTAGLPLGDYVVVVSILEQGTDAELGSSMPRNASLALEGEIEDLGTFDFNFAAAGNIAFSVDYGDASGSNCAGGLGGESVEDQEVSVTLQTSAECISLALLKNDVQELGDICAELAPCIEGNLIQTLANVPAGDYSMIIEGLFDNAGTSVACFSTTFTFPVDGDDDLGIVAVPFAPMAGAETFCGTV
jgi:hypothetical protein